MTMDEFKLGNPALVCRWRLAHGKLPLLNRHLRALGARKLGDESVSPSLVAWAKQRIEWGLDEATCAHPDGTLMLIIDEAGASAMTVGPYRPLQQTSANDLLARAESAWLEGQTTGVAPEELWAVEGDALVRACASDFAPSGASSLILDLARTMGMPVAREEGMLADARRRGFADHEVFLVSDEHGVTVASDKGGRRARKFAQSYAKLLKRR